MSDHNIILFDLIGLSDKNTPYRNPRNTSWVNYAENLRNCLEQVEVSRPARHQLELEYMVEQVTTAIISSYESSCPLKTKTRQKEVQWWNKTLSKTRSEVRALFNRAKRDGNWQRYTEALTRYNRELRKAKRNNFRKFCEDISETPQASRLHKVLAKDKTETTVSLRKSDGSYTENEEQRALVLLEAHFPGSTLSVNHTEEIICTRARSDNWKISADIFTQSRIDWAIETFQPYKTSGVDGIIPILLQRGKTELLPYLIRIFRSSLAIGYIPVSWRRAKVIFIPKVGKKFF